MARDNFTPALVRKLRDRVNSLCSNPNCRATTLAPSGNDSVNNIGVAAHIAAASPGGPRYDENMSPIERKSINNAIWLCSNCSIKIDRDSESHSVDLLNEWKMKAEGRAKIEQGKKLPNANDAINTLAQALTGFPKSFISSAIENTHQATTKVLNSLDTRFHVNTSYINGAVEYHIQAKEPVEIIINGTDEYWRGLKNLIDNGLDFSVSTESISFEGSELFKSLFDDTNIGTLTVNSKKIEALLKIWIVEKSTGIINAFDDVKGFISIGSKKFHFDGSACGGIFKALLSAPVKDSSVTSTINFTVDYSKWDGLELKRLSYFEKIFSFFDSMSLGWELHVNIEVDGMSAWKGKVNGKTIASDVISFLHYTRCCSLISKKSNLDIFFDSGVTYSSAQHKRIEEVANGITGKLKEPAKACLDSVNFIALSEIVSLKQPVLLKFIEKSDEKITLFSTPCLISNKTILVDMVIPQLEKNSRLDKKVDLLFVPDENCKVMIDFDVIKNNFSN